MKKIHKDKFGNILPIAALSNEHLLNVIKLGVQKCIPKIDSSADNLTPYQKKLYGIETPDVDKTVLGVEKFMDDYYPYIIEAYLRDMKEVRMLLVAINENRTSSLTINPAFMLGAPDGFLNDFDNGKNT